MVKGLRLLFFKMALMVLLVSLASFGVIVSLPPDYSNYFSAILDKHNLLLETPSPRIILIGGSNVAFGIDSELLGHEMKMSVINDGLHAGLGLEFMLNDLKFYITSGDVIVIAPEYSEFYGNSFRGDNKTLAGLLEVDPEAIKSLSPSQLLRVPDLFIAVLQIKSSRKLASLLSASSTSDSIYYRGAFNEHGDVISHLGKQGIPLDNSPYITEDESLNPEAVEILNKFYKYAKASGAKVYLAFPAARQSNCAANRVQFQELYDYLEANLDVPILSRPEEFCFPDDYFFDTDYHLNMLGREVRTMVLADIIREIH